MTREGGRLPRSLEELEALVERRAAQLRTVYEIAEIANESDELDRALLRAMELLVERNGWVLGHAILPAEDDPELFLDAGLWVRRGGGDTSAFEEASRRLAFRRDDFLVGEVLSSGAARAVGDVTREPRFARAGVARAAGLRGAFLFPVRIRDRAAGVLEFFSRDELAAEPELLVLMARAGTQLGRVVERRRAARDLAEAAIREREAIGRTLHDGPAQDLVGLGLTARSLRERMRSDGAQYDALLEGIEGAARSLREIAGGLYSARVEAVELLPVLRQLAASRNGVGGVEVTLEVDGAFRPPDDAGATHLYHIARQALHNALEHAGARSVGVSLRDAQGPLLEVRDDGRGFDPAAPNGRATGTRIMRYRAQAMGGVLEIASSPGGGTRVRCHVRRMLASEAARSDEPE